MSIQRTPCLPWDSHSALLLGSPKREHWGGAGSQGETRAFGGMVSQRRAHCHPVTLCEVRFTHCHPVTANVWGEAHTLPSCHTPHHFLFYYTISFMTALTFCQKFFSASLSDINDSLSSLSFLYLCIHYYIYHPLWETFEIFTFVNYKSNMHTH